MTEGLPRPVSTEDDYESWYIEAMTASNEAGFVGASAAETIRTLVSERDALASRVRALEGSARRYEWLRAQIWNDNTLAVVLRPKDNTKLGCFLPFDKLLDDAIDHMSAALTTTSGDSHG